MFFFVFPAVPKPTDLQPQNWGTHQNADFVYGYSTTDTSLCSVDLSYNDPISSPNLTMLHQVSIKSY